MQPTDVDSAVAMVELGGKFDIMMQNIASVKEKQEEMAMNISEIREAVYHPYEGIYARVRELEHWKQTTARIVWVILTTTIGLTIATIYKNIFP